MAVKGLDTLIRLQKRSIDALRRELGLLEEQYHQLLLVSQALRVEYKTEQEKALASPEGISFLASYAEGVRLRQERLQREMKNTNDAVNEKRERIAEAFGTQKTYEIARDQALKRQEEKTRRMQQERFDEIGVQQYLRSQTENR
jgi:flagellar export protein FliJ